MQGKIRLSGIVNDSIVDGTGLRMVIFTQGCIHGCKGCHNPQTHDINGGYDGDLQEIYEKFLSNPLLNGLTLSGGEPFLQAEKLIPLCEAVKRQDKDIWAFSGFTFDELENDIVKDSSRLLKLVDILVDGRFEADKLDLNLWYRGSSNQRVIDVKKTLGNKNNDIIIIPFDEQ